MTQSACDPRQYGIGRDYEDFCRLVDQEFQDCFQGKLTPAELLLHPREALNFCDAVRRKHGWYFVPDDIVLRSLQEGTR